ncbi:hypothetical protein SLE2022_160330 [Rubroshorea leprosula]
MGELYINAENSEIPLRACYGDVSDTNLLLEFLGVFSSLNNIFAHVVALTACIGRRFICFIEDLVLKDVITSGPRRSSSSHGNYKFLLEERFSSSKSCTVNTSPRILGRRLLTENSLVNAHSEAVETNHSKQGIAFIVQGLHDMRSSGIEEKL